MASGVRRDSQSTEEASKSSDNDYNLNSSDDTSSFSYERKTNCRFDAKKKQKHSPPTQASDWDEVDLSKIGIVYNSEPTELAEMFSQLKRSNPNLPELPQFCRKLADFTRRMWTFSGNSAFLSNDLNILWVENQYNPEKPCRCTKKMSEMTSVRKNEFIEEQLKLVNGSVDNFDACCNDLKQEISEDLKKSFIADDLYHEWRNRLIGFWEYFGSLIRRLSTTPIQIEGTELFKEFCRIFFLIPEAGEAYHERICIKSTTVQGGPHVRFVDKDAQKVLIVTAVKHHKALRMQSLKTFSHKNICHHVLGEHGLQLLLNIRNSFFRPFIMGILCIGTQLIFTSLSVDVLDLIKIEDKRDIPCPHSYIFYSRPFDFMIESDRKELFEHLFWFGILQHGRRLDSLT